MKGRTYRYMENEAQYPFGYGLNYGDTVLKGAVYQNSTITATVENQGTMDTDEVVQVYIKSETSSDAPRNSQLCAFKRIFVKAGETVTVELPISSRAFTVVNARGERYIPEGAFQLYVSFGQPDARTEALTKKKAIALTVDPMI